jgi:hypothetical protein
MWVEIQEYGAPQIIILSGVGDTKLNNLLFGDIVLN